MISGSVSLLFTVRKKSAICLGFATPPTLPPLKNVKQSTQKTSGPGKRMKIIRQILLAIIVVSSAQVAFPRYIVATWSMEPTIPQGSYVVASRIPMWVSDPSAGDIVVFHPEDRISKFPWMHRILGEPGMPIADFSGLKPPPKDFWMF